VIAQIDAGVGFPRRVSALVSISMWLYQQASPVPVARGLPIEQTGGHCSPQDAVTVINRSMPAA
jgi:hypothetical protein